MDRKKIWRSLAGTFAAGTVKAVVFWSAAGLLAVVSGRNIVKIADSGQSAAVSGTLSDYVQTGRDGVTAAQTDGAVGLDGAAGIDGAVGLDGAADTGAAVGLDRSAGRDGEVGTDAAEESVQPVESGVPEVSEPMEMAQEKRAALTFDDGPHPVYTKKLLDGLAQRGVKATFFVVGKNIPGNEELIARMEAEGHLIGNHTYDHVKICDMTEDGACEQVEKTSALVREITGKNTEFVRPPFGAWKKGMECSFTMIPVLWDVDPLDWTTKNTGLVVSRVLDDVEDGDIILLHDYYDSSVEAALQIVDKLQSEGYEFVTVDQMILE